MEITIEDNSVEDKSDEDNLVFVIEGLKHSMTELEDAEEIGSRFATIQERRIYPHGYRYKTLTERLQNEFNFSEIIRCYEKHAPALITGRLHELQSVLFLSQKYLARRYSPSTIAEMMQKSEPQTYCIPSEIWYEISQHLDISSKIQLANTCQRIRESIWDSAEAAAIYSKTYKMGTHQITCDLYKISLSGNYWETPAFEINHLGSNIMVRFRKFADLLNLDDGILDGSIYLCCYERDHIYVFSDADGIEVNDIYYCRTCEDFVKVRASREDHVHVESANPPTREEIVQTFANYRGECEFVMP